MVQRTDESPDSAAVAAKVRPAAPHSLRATFALIVTLSLVASAVLLVSGDRSPPQGPTTAGRESGAREPPVVAAIPQGRAAGAPEPAASASAGTATPSAGSQPPRTGLRTPDAAVTALSATELKSRLVGRWKCEVYGSQIIDNHPDGQAQLTAELDLVAALLYGGRLTMQLAWNVSDGVLTHELKSGEPRENVEKLIRDRGSHRSYLILELNGQRMLLQDVDRPEIVRTWTRLP